MLTDKPISRCFLALIWFDWANILKMNFTSY